MRYGEASHLTMAVPMPFFRDKVQKAGFYGYVGGLATALALWGFSVEGWVGKVMAGVATLTITFLLLASNGMLGGED
jgi:hypothetical protein